MIRACSGRLAAAVSMAILTTAAAADERPGNLWDTTSQMSMPGLPAMPPQKMQLCTAKEWTQPPPPPPGQSCTVSNFERDGSKVSWDTQCTGEMEMSGHGEITFTTDEAYTGTIVFTAEGMTMTVNLTGQKVDECDNPIS
ncbi:MAG TPA: DUF3617 family protein [Steroidobacteraceae bacterium]|jgi:hypothetical protein|nr:DUF3617 family protein [Steroidobacteraceae bacterium]